MIHFRNKGKNRSNYVFQVGNETIEYTTTYKYLGIVLHENLDFTVTADTLFNSGGRALGSMISKIHNFKDIGFEAYSKLHNSCVVPVTDYCSGVWGFWNFPKSDIVQNRAIRYYLGVHRFTPTLALSGDMGWTISVHRRWLNIIRLWNHLVDMDDDRLTKKVFVYDFNKNTNSTWCSEVKSILEKIGLRTRCFQNMIKCDIKYVNSHYSITTAMNGQLNLETCQNCIHT